MSKEEREKAYQQTIEETCTLLGMTKKELEVLLKGGAKG